MTKTITLISAGLLGLGMLAAGPAAAGCFTVYNSKGHFVQRSSETPVNLAPQLRRTVPQRFGRGATMAFRTDGDQCSDFSFPKKAARGRGNTSADTDAILTDLVRAREYAYGGGRGDTWLADVRFNGK